MLLVTTCGQRSPKVLMISAVCGRAPPRVTDPPPPDAPALYPPISHDWLSVINTRGLGLSCAIAEPTARLSSTSVTDKAFCITASIRLHVVWGENRGRRYYPPAATKVNANWEKNTGAFPGR